MFHKRTIPVLLLVTAIYSSIFSGFVLADDDVTPTEEPTPEVTITQEPTQPLTPTPQVESVGENSVQTQDASSSATITNNVNENINGTDLDVTPAVNVEQSNDAPLDLTEAPQPCHQESQPSATESGSITNDNDAVIDNNIDVSADTGDNAASGITSSVETGDATVEVNVVNTANTNITGDCAHYGSVNIFAPQSGDVILPYEGSYVVPTGAVSHAGSVQNTNEATVNTAVDASADTGNNSAQIIDTGNSTVTVRQIDSVNTNITGDNWILVKVNGADLWTGDFVGWDGQTVRTDTYAMAWAQLPIELSQTESSVSNNNKAVVNTTIHASAETGDNNAYGFISSVDSGDARVEVNILNVLNTNITGSHWYYEAINVFDTFTGNIVFPRPDLVVNISSETKAAHTGYEVRYIISYENTGHLWADGVTIDAALPEGAEVLSIPDGTYADGVLHWKPGFVKQGGRGEYIVVAKLEKGPVNDIWKARAAITTTTLEQRTDNNYSEFVISNILPEPVAAVTIIPSIVPVEAEQMAPAYKPASVNIVSEQHQALQPGEIKPGTVLSAMTKTEKSHSLKTVGFLSLIAFGMYLTYRLRRGVALPLFK